MGGGGVPSEGLEKRRRRMKILLTGFDPFGGEAINPAWEAVLRASAPEKTTLVRLQVPTVFRRSLDIAWDAVLQEAPDAVLCVGQAGGRAALTPETAAVNLCEARIPDNSGFQPHGVLTVPGGPDVLESTLSADALAAAIAAAGVPAEVSHSAGTFVCNHLLYGLLYRAAEQRPGLSVGFLHVPFLPEQAAMLPGAPSLPLETIVCGLNAALAAISDLKKQS